jgi:hypothetical protein
MQIVRACSGAFHSRPEWKLMHELNKIRNDIAHRSRHKPLKIEIEKLRKATIGMSRKKKEVEHLDIEKLVVHAALTCCGFLAVLTDELKKAQGKEVEDD